MPKKIGADHGPIDRDAPQPITKQVTVTAKAALCLDMFNLSATKAVATSCKKIHEVIAAFVAERLNMSRHKAALAVTVTCFVIGCGASLSMGPWSAPIFFGMNFFDFLDFFTAQIILPLTEIGRASCRERV